MKYDSGKRLDSCITAYYLKYLSKRAEKSQNNLILSGEVLLILEG